MPNEPEREILASSALSAAQIEQRLGLPVGAAKRRRLFVVTVLRPPSAGGPLRRGDNLIVEPGAQTTPGRVVLCAQEDAMTLGRVRLDVHGRAVVTALDCDGLPLPKAPAPRVLGTVIARLAGRGRRRNARPTAVIARTAAATTVRPGGAGAASKVARLAQLNARLATLRRCLNSVGEQRLQRALEIEAARAESAIRREVGNGARRQVARPLRRRAEA